MFDRAIETLDRFRVIAGEVQLLASLVIVAPQYSIARSSTEQAREENRYSQIRLFKSVFIQNIR